MRGSHRCPVGLNPWKRSASELGATSGGSERERVSPTSLMIRLMDKGGLMYLEARMLKGSQASCCPLGDPADRASDLR